MVERRLAVQRAPYPTEQLAAMTFALTTVLLQRTTGRNASRVINGALASSSSIPYPSHARPKRTMVRWYRSSRANA